MPTTATAPPAPTLPPPLPFRSRSPRPAGPPPGTPNVEILRDRALVAQVAGGCDDALGALFDRHAAMLLAFLEGLIGAGGQAEEVLQETFFQVWRQAGRYRPERATPRGWMMMIARSRALDRMSTRSARRRREERVGSEGLPVAAPLGSLRLEQGETRRRVLAALGRLPAEQRQVVVLAFYEGLTQVEIAERLGAPLGTVKSRALLGLKKLRALLAAEGPQAATTPSRPPAAHAASA